MDKYIKLTQEKDTEDLKKETDISEKVTDLPEATELPEVTDLPETTETEVVAVLPVRDDTEIAVIKRRSYEVYKQNDAVRKARYDLSVTETKILAFIISSIKPTDVEGQLMTFDINEFCKVCNINIGGGSAKSHVADVIQKLADKSWWFPDTKIAGKKNLVRWLDKVSINENKNTLQFVIHEEFSPYVYGIAHDEGDYTKWALEEIIYMKSKYSSRIYELLKSYASLHRHTFYIDEMCNLLECPNSYLQYKYFKRRVLEPSIEEINKYSNLNVTYQPIKEYGKISKIEFHIKIVDAAENAFRKRRAQEEMLSKKGDAPGQMSIFSEEFYDKEGKVTKMPDPMPD